MNIIKRYKKQRWQKFFVKGMVQEIEKIKKDSEKSSANIPELLGNIDIGIAGITEEVANFSKALDDVETKYGKHSEASEVSTIFPFLSLSMLDILILHKQYLRTQDPIEKNFICRTAAQHMYEFLEDASKALGKQINHLTDSLNSVEVNDKLKNLRKSFNELKGELHEPLKKLRHNVSGHKDRDIRSQLLISKEIDLIEFQKNFVLFMLFFLTLTMFKRIVLDEIKCQQNS